MDKKTKDEGLRSLRSARGDVIDGMIEVMGFINDEAQSLEHAAKHVAAAHDDWEYEVDMIETFSRRLARLRSQYDDLKRSLEMYDLAILRVEAEPVTDDPEALHKFVHF